MAQKITAPVKSFSKAGWVTPGKGLIFVLTNLDQSRIVTRFRIGQCKNFLAALRSVEGQYPLAKKREELQKLYMLGQLSANDPVTLFFDNLPSVDGVFEKAPVSEYIAGSRIITDDDFFTIIFDTDAKTTGIR